VAAGAIAILGLETDAPHRRLWVQPSLPEWLADVELNLTVGDLLPSGARKKTRWKVTHGELQVYAND